MTETAQFPPAHVAVYAALALANFPFVLAIDWYSKHRPVRKIYDVSIDRKQIVREIKNSLITTPIHAVLLAALVESGLLRAGIEKPPSIAITFAIALIWTEIWHYASHRAMHWKPLHFIHREHHLSWATGPWSSVSFSVLEKLIFSLGIIGGMALLSRSFSVSLYGIATYYLVYFFTNALGHSNIEFRSGSYYDSFFGQLFNTPTFHAMHHARYIRNYGLLTPFLDRLFDTAWPDARDVQRRVAGGSPLRKLNERLFARTPQTAPAAKEGQPC